MMMPALYTGEPILPSEAEALMAGETSRKLVPYVQQEAEIHLRLPGDDAGGHCPARFGGAAPARSARTYGARPRRNAHAGSRRTNNPAGGGIIGCLASIPD